MAKFGKEGVLSKLFDGTCVINYKNDPAKSGAWFEVCTLQDEDGWTFKFSIEYDFLMNFKRAFAEASHKEGENEGYTIDERLSKMVFDRIGNLGALYSAILELIKRNTSYNARFFATYFLSTVSDPKCEGKNMVLEIRKDDTLLQIKLSDTMSPKWLSVKNKLGEYATSDVNDILKIMKNHKKIIEPAYRQLINSTYPPNSEQLGIAEMSKLLA